MALNICRTLCNANNCLSGQLLNISSAIQFSLCNSFHSIIGPPTNPGLLNSLSGVRNTPGNVWSLITVRTNIRNNFPRPSEKKRLQNSFWNRMKTPGGRAVIMRRYLKGRHVLSN